MVEEIWNKFYEWNVREEKWKLFLKMCWNILVLNGF